MKHLINIPLSLISQLVLSGIVRAFVMRRDKDVESVWANKAVPTPVASQAGQHEGSLSPQVAGEEAPELQRRQLQGRDQTQNTVSMSNTCPPHTERRGRLPHFGCCKH